jgi:hypothetical protein
LAAGTAHLEVSQTQPHCLSALIVAVQFIVMLMGYAETRGVTLEEMQKKLGIA